MIQAGAQFSSNGPAPGEVSQCSAMARKNAEQGRPARGPKSPSKSPATPRASPVRVRSPEGSPRGSPGLAAGHYAGCKWTEPPLPSSLPAPPQHWMQAAGPPRPRAPIRPFHAPKPDYEDIAGQLKVLLKVQA